MRGRSSSTKARLRSAGYKCNLCSRRLIDVASLERHLKSVHNVAKGGKLNVEFKSKPPAKTKVTNRAKEKLNLQKEHILEQAMVKATKNINDNVINTTKAVDKTINKRKIDLDENGEVKDVSEKIDEKVLPKKTQFECPVCLRTFAVYFNAHRHMQKEHPMGPNGKEMWPVRVETCYGCNKRIRCNEAHKCGKMIEKHVTDISEYFCTGCNQGFMSLRSFDIHVAGLHTDATDSMFFPSKLEFMTWRLEMEKQTKAKYSLYGEYESKKVYHCNYEKNYDLDKYTKHLCPSSIVVQEYSKGIQVHYYYKHYDHSCNTYTLSSKYKKYFITSYLRGRIEDSVEYAKALIPNDKELFPQFKKLMYSITNNAAEVDISVLKNLIEKALEMSEILTDTAANQITAKAPKKMSDKEITEALGMKIDAEKRRRSVDSYETTVKPAKRMRNKSLFNQSPKKMSPKIVNTFSLATNTNTNEFNDNEFDSLKSDTDTEKSKDSETVNTVTRMSTRLSGISESLSFNDSYKDFIDKNFISKSEDKTETKIRYTGVKTKLGFKQPSPKKVDNRAETESPVMNRRKPILMNKATEEEVSKDTTKTDTSKSSALTESPKVASIEMDLKESSSAISTPEVNTPKVKSLSQPMDPLQIKDKESSPYEIRLTRVNTRNSPLVDPLELNINKSKPVKVTPIPPMQRIIAKANKNVASPIDELRVTKVDTVDPLKHTPRIIKKVYSGPGPLKTTSPVIATPKTTSPVTATPKITPTIAPTPTPTTVRKVTPKVTPKPTPKPTPKVTFADDKPSTSSVKLTPTKKIKEIEYEVREQENDCNILVLKF